MLLNILVASNCISKCCALDIDNSRNRFNLWIFGLAKTLWYICQANVFCVGTYEIIVTLVPIALYASTVCCTDRT